MLFWNLSAEWLRIIFDMDLWRCSEALLRDRRDVDRSSFAISLALAGLGYLLFDFECIIKFIQSMREITHADWIIVNPKIFDCFVFIIELDVWTQNQEYIIEVQRAKANSTTNPKKPFWISCWRKEKHITDETIVIKLCRIKTQWITYKKTQNIGSPPHHNKER